MPAGLVKHPRVFEGSYLRVTADVQWSLHCRNAAGKRTGQVRLNCQFCLKSGCPEGVSVRGNDGAGEGAAAAELLPPDADVGCVYLFDSGVVKFSYLRRILQRRGHFLCNLREHVGFDAEADPCAADRAAGVCRDRVGRLRSSHAPPGADAAPAAVLREVRVSYADRGAKNQRVNPQGRRTL
jgi:hypothetical protein